MGFGVATAAVLPVVIGESVEGVGVGVKEVADVKPVEDIPVLHKVPL